VTPIRHVFELRALVALSFFGIAAAAIWRLRRVNGLAGLGLSWFLLLLIPSSLLVVLDQGEPMAEHRVYLAGAGLFVAVGAAAGWLMTSLTRPRTRRLARGVFAVGGHAVRVGRRVRNYVGAPAAVSRLVA